MAKVMIAAACLGVLGTATTAVAHHQSDAPRKLSVIENVYPGLFGRELARPAGELSWNHLRRMVWSRWRDTHPAAEREHRMDDLADIGTPEANRELARLYFGDAFPCADEIIQGESNYDHLVWNRQGSGAYGLGQARPRDKMLAYGADAYTNPLTQLEWFKGYAEARYGSVCGASAHWNAVVSW